MDNVMVIIKAAAVSFSVPAFALFYLQNFFKRNEFISVCMQCTVTATYYIHVHMHSMHIFSTFFLFQQRA